MVEISDIKRTLSIETILIEKTFEKEDLLIDDESLDQAIRFTKSFNKLNDGFIRIIDSLDDFGTITIKNEQDELDVREVLDELKKMNRKAIAIWIHINNDDFLKVACKSALLDFRINIRTIKEYIEDIHNKFFLRDKRTVELNDLFESL